MDDSIRLLVFLSVIKILVAKYMDIIFSNRVSDKIFKVCARSIVDQKQ